MTACCGQSQRVRPAHPGGGGRFPGQGGTKATPLFQRDANPNLPSDPVGH